MDFLTLRGESARAHSASDAVVVGEWAFVNNVLPVDLDDDAVPLPEYIEEQTLKVLSNLDVILSRIGASRTDVVSVRVAVTRLEQLSKRFELAYERAFEAGRLPTRSVIGVVALTRGAQVAMDFTVRLPAA